MPRGRSESDLGEQLRDLRESHGWSLREVATKAGVNHGYLSQLERGEVSQPAPSMLHKVAAGYDVPFVLLMRWAGYIESEEPGLTPNQEIALSYLGDDVSKGELAAIKAVLDAIRSKRATFGHHAESLDSDLGPEERREIRARVLMLLRRADALDVLPTPLEQVMDVAQLVAAGEITLDKDERRQLRKRFGALVDLVISRLRGAIHFGAREVWVQPDLYELRKRFVTAHEIGHGVLPWQRDVIAYLDDDERLRPDVHVTFERQANQAAIELLAQGDSLRREADDSRLTGALISELSAKYEISLQAISRRIVEETRHDAALAVRFRGPSGGLGPYHLYCSSTFGLKFGWNLTAMPAEAKQATRDAAREFGMASFLTVDRSSAFIDMKVETIDTRYALFALFVPSKSDRAIQRFLRVG